MSNYSKANTAVQWFQDDYPGAEIDPNVGVVHTTEGTGWPSYAGGATAPNYTARPNFARKRLDWRGHFPDERSSRALRNTAGGVETNTLNACQVELVGTCDPATHHRWKQAGIEHIFWPEAPEWALRDLAEFVLDMHERHGFELDTVRFMAYPASYGVDNPNRFSHRRWRSFYGWCGHQHVPENSHGDPGALNMRKVIDMAKQMKGGNRDRLLRLQHTSLQFSDPGLQHRHDAQLMFEPHPHVLTWTEAGKAGPGRSLYDAIRNQLKGSPYAGHVHPFGCGVAVRKNFGKIVKRGYVPAVDGVKGKRNPRGLVWVKVRTKAKRRRDRETIFFGATHYPTRRSQPKRRPLDRAIAKAIGKWARFRARGVRLAFVSGDFNLNDRKDDVFFGQPLTTCWDELGKWPSTGHGPIDAIGSFDGDGRVSCSRAFVLRDNKLPLHTDHFTVRANYLLKGK